MTESAILEEIEKYDCDYVVLTGGEPMVAPQIHHLASAIRVTGRHITIESAATIPPQEIACDLASLSPKLSNSTPDKIISRSWRQRHDDLRWQPDVVRSWIKAYRFQLKFVVCSEGDLDEVETMVGALGPRVEPQSIYLMPEGITTVALRERASWVAEICRQRGYRYGHRLQIELFGNTRGT